MRSTSERNILSSTSTGKVNGVPRFGAPLPSPISQGNPRPYQPGLTPLPSPRHPHCLARDHLLLWLPVSTRKLGSSTALTDHDLSWVLTVITASWAHGTRETYGSGLLVYHVFCDLRGVPDAECCPADPTLVLSFLSACAGSYSGNALANHLYALQAWHTLHGMPWTMTKTEMTATLDGAVALAPSTSKKAKRDPFTTHLIVQLCNCLDISVPLDASINACLKTTFWSTARLGEFTVPNLTSFDPAIHIKRSDVRSAEDREGHKVKVFFVPRTKSSPLGEDLYWARQDGDCDPESAFDNHLMVNNFPLDTPLFAYRHSSGYFRPLTRTAFTKRLNSIALQLGLGVLRFHGIRIGSVLEYLLRGLPLEVVKSMGRWSSDAFAVYLRRHAIVLAPYIQNNPVLEPFTWVTLPPVR